MSLRPILVWLAVAVGLILSAMPAQAQRTYGDCYFDGTPPFCEGRCRPGYVIRSQKFCFSGVRVQCCRRIECTPARYGQPGCPYPSFVPKPGSNVGRPQPCPAGTSGYYPNCKKDPTDRCPRGMKGRPPNCELDVR